MGRILTEISAGELLDKISILEIKLEKVKNKNDQGKINIEYKMLIKARDSNIKITEKIKQLIKDIKEVNLPSSRNKSIDSAIKLLAANEYTEVSTDLSTSAPI